MIGNVSIGENEENSPAAFIFPFASGRFVFCYFFHSLLFMVVLPCILISLELLILTSRN